MTPEKPVPKAKSKFSNQPPLAPETETHPETVAHETLVHETLAHETLAQETLAQETLHPDTLVAPHLNRAEIDQAHTPQSISEPVSDLPQESGSGAADLDGPDVTATTAREPEKAASVIPVVVKPAYGKAAGLGGLVGAIVASGVFLAAPKLLPQLLPDDGLKQQVAALQASVKTSETSPKSLAALQEPLAALDARLKALEGKSAELPPAKDAAPAPDVSGIEARLAKLETVQTATKAENRIIMEQSAAASKQDVSANLAVAIQALNLTAARGAPFAAEFAAAEALGADKAKLDTIKPFAASGLPNNAALGAELNNLAKASEKSATSQDAAGPPKSYWDRLSAGAANLVKIRSKDAPEVASVAPISTLLAKGAVSDAVALQAKLPEPLLSATKPWAEKAAARAAAEAALQGLWNDALANLTIPKN